MACHKRTVTGTCGHHQCEYPDYSGYSCVSTFYSDALERRCCEIGENCTRDCDLSFRGTEADRVNEEIDAEYRARAEAEGLLDPD